MKSDENKINRPKNKTTGAVLGLRTAPVCGIRAGSRNSRRKRFKKKLRFSGAVDADDRRFFMIFNMKGSVLDNIVASERFADIAAG